MTTNAYITDLETRNAELTSDLAAAREQQERQATVIQSYYDAVKRAGYDPCDFTKAIDKMAAELAAANATVEKLTNTLRIYADRANWTDHDDWPTSEDGMVVFARDATRRDMKTPGWTEAKAAITAAEAAREGKET